MCVGDRSVMMAASITSLLGMFVLCYVRNVTSIVTRMVFCGSGIGA